MIRKLLGPTLVTMVVATTLASSANAVAGDITLSSTDDAGTKGNGLSQVAGLSADGTKVAFSSEGDSA